MIIGLIATEVLALLPWLGLFWIFLVLFGSRHVLRHVMAILDILGHLSIVQASSSFKLLDTCMFTYTTPTFITEALRLVTLVQLLLMTVAVN